MGRFIRRWSLSPWSISKGISTVHRIIGGGVIGMIIGFAAGLPGSRVMAEKLKGRTIRRIFGVVLLVFALKLIQNVFW